jgi:hypothetical protein
MARHGAYLCLSAPPDASAALAAADVAAVASRHGLQNEYFAQAGHPQEAIAFLRRVEVTPADIEDEGLASAAAIVHVASNDAATVAAVTTGIEALLPATVRSCVLTGAVQPTQYTGGAMHDFAYAHQRVQESGESMPVGFLLPLRKTAEWWAKDWMERHTYFLPCYDSERRMVHEGHPLAAAAGIPALMRRTYRCGGAPPAREGYDFLTYFECAVADVAAFHAVCAALRDVRRNPEWRFVREGPAWCGRRVEGWPALWTAP